MNKINSRKYWNIFYKIFKINGISEPYSSLKYLLFNSKYFKKNLSKNKLLPNNHNLLLYYSTFNKQFKRKTIFFNQFEKSKFIKDCFLRLKHIPIQYILKQWHFRNKIFLVDYNILIPRIETEKLVELTDKMTT